MGVDQYHEPAEELSQEMGTFARMIASLIEEAEAISWYEQRMLLEKNEEATPSWPTRKRTSSSTSA